MSLFTPEQMASTIVQVGNSMGITPKGQKMAIACVKVEGKYLIWANKKSELSRRFPYDAVGNDSYSEGPYQQQPPWGGGTDYESTRKRMDLVESTRMFFTELKKRDYNSDSRSPGMWVYDVQKCAPEFKGRYDEAYGEAIALYNKVTSGGTPATPSAFFAEHNIIDGENASNRRGHQPRLIVLHTEEGNMLGQALDDWMDRNSVSYHYIVDPDGTAWDTVDTDLSSWSVLDANPECINLVFGGSYAAQTRQQWIDKFGRAIKTAAFLVAQDCRKYGIPAQVLVGPRYGDLRTTNGVTDHYGITKGLGIGTHTDVGNGFPWDLFNTYLQQFAAGVIEEDDMFTDADRVLLQRVHFELTNKWESRSIYRTPGEGPVDTLAGFQLNEDGMEHAEMVERLAVLGDEDALARVQRTADGKGAVTDKATIARAKKVLAQAKKAAEAVEEVTADAGS